MLQTALDRAIAEVAEQNEQTALVGCYLVDRFRRDRTASKLEELKDYVRLGLQDVSAHLARFRSRDQRRVSHFSARARRKPSLGPQINAHVAALRFRTRLYEDRRTVLRQIADAAVWIMLDLDIRRIAPQFKDGGHDLPTSTGLAGVIQLQRQLHASGRFLAMECDLTRCSGFGDLVIGRADGVPCTPFLLEVKTHSDREELTAGMFVEILTLTSASNHPRDQETLKLLTDTIGKDLEGELVVSTRAEKQAAEIAERVSLIAQALYSGTRSIDPPQRNWQPLINVVRRAQQQGQSFDLAEDGVYYFAAQVKNNPDIRTSVSQVRNAILSLEPGPLAGGVSYDVHGRDDLSGIILPFALWDVPRDVRAALLCNSVIVGTFMRRDLIPAAFARYGISMMVENGEWLLQRGATEVRLNPLHATAVQLGSVIGCMSPQSVVLRLSVAVAAMEER